MTEALAPAPTHSETPDRALLAMLTQALAEIFSLDPATITPDAPFERFGLDSIDAVLATDALGQRLGLELAPEFLMQHRTLDEVTAAVAQLRAAHQPAVAPVETPVFLFPGGGGRDMRLGRLARACGDRLGFETVDIGRWDEWIAAADTLHDLVARCCAQIEQRCPDGPLRLAAYSQGSHVAFATALALQARGRPVAWLALFDSAMAPIYPRIHLSRRARWVARTGKRALLAALQRVHRQTRLPIPGGVQARDQTDALLRVFAEMVQLFEGPATLRLAERVAANRRGRLQPRNLVAFESAVQIHLLDRLWRRWRATAPAAAIFEGELLLIRSQHPGPADLGWSPHCRSLRIVPATGDHLSMFDPDHLERLSGSFLDAVADAG